MFSLRLPGFSLPELCMLCGKVVLFFAWATLAAPAWGDDAAPKALQQHQLQRQQQQEQLQLRMHQQQRAVQSPATDARQKQAIDLLEINQQQRQQELQYRQQIEPQTAQPSDDEGTRRAKAQMEQQKAQQQSQQQLQRFDSELQQHAEKNRKEPSRGEIRAD